MSSIHQSKGAHPHGSHWAQCSAAVCAFLKWRHGSAEHFRLLLTRAAPCLHHGPRHRKESKLNMHVFFLQIGFERNSLVPQPKARRTHLNHLENCLIHAVINITHMWTNHTVTNQSEISVLRNCQWDKKNQLAVWDKAPICLWFLEVLSASMQSGRNKVAGEWPRMQVWLTGAGHWAAQIPRNPFSWVSCQCWPEQSEIQSSTTVLMPFQPSLDVFLNSPSPL